jgi:cardiolipin synthase
MTTPTATLLVVAHATVALGVTTHVLLGRRSPGSAVAWIGLAWLSPFVGGALYLLLGINRVRRRASGLGRRDRPPPGDAAVPAGPAGHLAALETAGRALSGAELTGGNTVAVLEGGDVAYPAMQAAIDAARHSVGLSTYIFRADAAGLPILDALTRAARRGVAVRVLVDGYGGGYFSSPAYRYLSAAGVPVARFLHSPLPWRMPLLNLRSHKKILAVDGRVAFTGGLNIGAENLARAGAKERVRDLHFRFQGPLVAQVVAAFREDWYFATREDLGAAAGLVAPAAAGAVRARVVESGPDSDVGKVELLVLEALGAANTAINVATPYFLPDERVLTALALAALRGVAVNLVVPEHSNKRLADWATRSALGTLLEAGCRVWYEGAPFDHSKLMTVDGAWSLVGSTNWDARSFRLNFELDVEVYDQSFARALDALLLARCRRQLTQETLAKRSIAARLRDNTAYLLQPYL